jgi:hypothetical protein
MASENSEKANFVFSTGGEGWFFRLTGKNTISSISPTPLTSDLSRFEVSKSEDASWEKKTRAETILWASGLYKACMGKNSFSFAVLFESLFWEKMGLIISNKERISDKLFVVIVGPLLSSFTRDHADHFKLFVDRFFNFEEFKFSNETEVTLKEYRLKIALVLKYWLYLVLSGNVGSLAFSVSSFTFVEGTGFADFAATAMTVWKLRSISMGLNKAEPLKSEIFRRFIVESFSSIENYVPPATLNILWSTVFFPNPTEENFLSFCESLANVARAAKMSLDRKEYTPKELESYLLGPRVISSIIPPSSSIGNSSSSGGKSYTGFCHVCHIKGHAKDDCPYIRLKEVGRERGLTEKETSLICHRCLGFGHFANGCVLTLKTGEVPSAGGGKKTNGSESRGAPRQGK